jgi:hypothetical protein
MASNSVSQASVELAVEVVPAGAGQSAHQLYLPAIDR